MIHDLRPYPVMKDSGVPWLGQVPEHWDMERLDRLFMLRKEEPQPDDQRVTGYLDGRVTLRSNVQGQKIKGVIKEAGWQRIHPGDFAISGMNAHLGGVGVSDSLGKCSPIYLVLEPKQNTYAQFVSLTVRHLALSGVLKSLVQTIRFNSADFKRDDLKKLDVWLPPPDEQAAIVRFLDHADRRIRKAIAAKQKLIKLLQEQKQVIIHQAVTRGLDPNVKLKPSGVEWLGDVPEGWGVAANRSALKVRKKLVGKQSADYTLLSLTLNGIIPRDLENAKGKFPADFDTYQEVKAGQMVMCLFDVDETPRTVGLSDISGMITGAYDVFDVSPRFSRRYLYNWFLSLDRVKGLRPFYSGLRKVVPRERFMSLKFPLPPMVEQEAISDFIEIRERELDHTTSRAQQEIALLREYRTRLIADVVTGKLDVRDAAARLPELTDEALPDELEADVDGEEVEGDEVEGEGVEA